MLTSVVYQAAVLFLPDGIELLHLGNDVLVIGKHIPGLDVGRLVLLHEQEGIADLVQTIENGLFLRIERVGGGGGLHGGRWWETMGRTAEVGKSTETPVREGFAYEKQ